MSEPTLAALAAVGGPLLKDAEQALAPEAEKVLGDLREFVAGETDKLRTELPAVVEQGTKHLHALGEAMLARYQSVMDRIDAHLGGSIPVPPTQSAAPSVPASTSSASSTAASEGSSAATVVSEHGPEVPLPSSGPTAAPEAHTQS